MTQAAQTASPDDSLDCESGHAGSAAADNGSSVRGCSIIFQVLSQRLQAGERGVGLPEHGLRWVRLTQHCCGANGMGE